MTRPALWKSIAASIRLQQSMGKSVWLVAHFLETFTDAQSMLEEHGLDYFVETEPVTIDWFRDHANAAGDQVRLLLADLAEPLVLDPESPFESELRVAMMVVERHPFGPRDDLVVEFASSLPAKVELGYFLALDDVLVQTMVPPQMIDLLKAMGLQEHDLISSSMVTKRLQKLIERTSRETKEDRVAESATDWFAMQNDG
ncbi:hypothetical protein MFFC18_26990 [Mariniblastus fucicola]|uniref:Preprotein translocase subunit SecA n=2 Tax=Mariniblastus fucicola TaxID=980251 RepID=A0A5B9P8W9_9BACT|nr:hypothetical protein MFFC18_26990 [Mariniblastus fucicola]